MADQGKPSELKVPAETQAKFPDLIGSIQKSQSMDAEERQYWVDALPVMTEDQIKNLRDILESEQKQIEKAQKETDKKTGDIAKKVEVDFNSFQYKEKKRLIQEAEIKEKTQDQKGLEALMNEMRQL